MKRIIKYDIHNDVWVCTRCGFQFNITTPIFKHIKPHYCPNCGSVGEIGEEKKRKLHFSDEEDEI